MRLAKLKLRSKPVDSPNLAMSHEGWGNGVVKTLAKKARMPMPDYEEHLKQIEVSAVSATTTQEDWRAASWMRCVGQYKLDPARPRIPGMSARELKLQNEIFNVDLSAAEIELENALTIIEEGGYSACIANRKGTIIAERRSRDATHFCNSDKVGAVWSEEVGGTNGIGTSILNMRPTAVFLNDHFFEEFSVQSCAAAPFFDPDGHLLGVVNFSTRNPNLQQSTHKVVFGVAQNVARRLETRYFREKFAKQFILNLDGEEASPAMLAIDDDFRLVGATHTARNILSLHDGAIGTRNLWAMFERTRDISSPESFCRKDTVLREIGCGVTFQIRGRKPTVLARTPDARPLSTRAASKKPETNARQRNPTISDCIGQDAGMRKNVSVLRRLMGSGLHMLLLGETGVGKDTLARALHDDSSRASGPYVAFNCSAVPESLIDSELFGYNSGAFTGASREGNTGRIIEAHDGTLFLDEIGDMPLVMQTRLLRFLESGEVTPLGGGKTRFVNAQVIAATNQNLVACVQKGTFRQDLFHRLAGAVVTIPALRERQDKAFLIEAVVEQYADGRKLKFSKNAYDLLLSHQWPGNIRELRNVIHRAAQMVEGNIIEIEDLTVGGFFSTGEIRMAGVSLDQTHPHQSQSMLSQPHEENAMSSGNGSAKNAVAIAERAALEKAISQSAGDAKLCAQYLGLSRATLYRKLKRHELSLN